MGRVKNQASMLGTHPVFTLTLFLACVRIKNLILKIKLKLDHFIV